MPLFLVFNLHVGYVSGELFGEVCGGEEQLEDDFAGINQRGL